MNLFLLRHGEAEPRAARDSLRQLTQSGRQDVQLIARLFAARQVTLDRCFVSPYVRAVQTASTFLDMLGAVVPQEEMDLLTPEVRASEVMHFLQSVKADNVLLVSHNPLLSELNALLTEGDIRDLHILGTSELVCISLDIVGLGMGITPYRLLPSDAAWHD